MAGVHPSTKMNVTVGVVSLRPWVSSCSQPPSAARMSGSRLRRTFSFLPAFLRSLALTLMARCPASVRLTAEHDHTCRIGCPNEPDSLTHYNECPRLFYFFLSFWRHATILPRRNHILHDLITRVFLRGLQYGIVVLGFLDASVYAHHKHRQDSENSGNFGDCIKGRIRFMTAITPAYAHAYQATCLAQHLIGVPHHNFQLPKPKSRYPCLPNARSITRERGNDYCGWATYTDVVVLALLMVKLLLDGV